MRTRPDKVRVLYPGGYQLGIQLVLQVPLPIRTCNLADSARKGTIHGCFGDGFDDARIHISARVRCSSHPKAFILQLFAIEVHWQAKRDVYVRV